MHPGTASIYIYVKASNKINSQESCSTTDINIGDKRIVYPWIGCGDCNHCNLGQEQLCSQPRNLGINLPGGYSTHVLVPHARYMMAIGDTPPELAATYACSGLTAYGAIKKLKSKYPNKEWILAGGLSPDNIKDALTFSEANFIDVNSGIEVSPGIKSTDALSQLFEQL